MDVFEIKAELSIDAVEAMDELLLERVDGRWSVLEDVIARRAWVVGVFESESEARECWNALRPETSGVFGEPVVRGLGDTDWRESYKLHFKPWRIARLHWVPVWERESYLLPPGDTAVWLDPGMAFGTGNHETTRLCVQRLVEFDQARRASACVIDAGCGSGILAISAAKLGFGNVAAFDNDPEAVRIARENAAGNGIAELIGFTVADLATGLEGRKADLLMANIQADVLVRYCAELVRAVARGGTLVLSGILAKELAGVRAVFEEASPGSKSEARTLGEWSDLTLRGQATRRRSSA